MRPPSASLLRPALHSPSQICIQTRASSSWMPRTKFARIKAIDKLHRRQRDARVQERLDSQARAAAMPPPNFSILSSSNTASSHLPASAEAQSPAPSSSRLSATSADTSLPRSRKPNRASFKATQEAAKASVSPPPSTAAIDLEPTPPANTSPSLADSSAESSAPATPRSTETTTTFIPRATAVTQPLPYLISRTPSLNLPIYESTKSGGSLHITTLRKLSGDLATLRLHLLSALNFESATVKNKRGRKKENVAINQNTRQLVIRGWRGAEVKKWCEMAGF